MTKDCPVYMCAALTISNYKKKKCTKQGGNQIGVNREWIKKRLIGQKFDQLQSGIGQLMRELINTERISYRMSPEKKRERILRNRRLYRN